MEFGRKRTARSTSAEYRERRRLRPGTAQEVCRQTAMGTAREAAEAYRKARAFALAGALPAAFAHYETAVSREHSSRNAARRCPGMFAKWGDPAWSGSAAGAAGWLDGIVRRHRDRASEAMRQAMYECPGPGLHEAHEAMERNLRERR